MHCTSGSLKRPVGLDQSMFHCSGSVVGVVCASPSKRLGEEVNLDLGGHLCLAELARELVWALHLGWEL